MDIKLRSEVSAFVRHMDVASLLVDTEAQAKFNEYYKTLFDVNIECTSCPGKVRNAIDRIKAAVENPYFTLKSNIMNYKLKPNTRVASRRLSMVITEHNMCDDNAINLLAENENNAACFEILAPDWKEAAAELRAKIIATAAALGKPAPVAFPVKEKAAEVTVPSKVAEKVPDPVPAPAHVSNQKASPKKSGNGGRK